MSRIVGAFNLLSTSTDNTAEITLCIRNERITVVLHVFSQVGFTCNASNARFGSRYGNIRIVRCVSHGFRASHNTAYIDGRSGIYRDSAVILAIGNSCRHTRNTADISFAGACNSYIHIIDTVIENVTITYDTAHIELVRILYSDRSRNRRIIQIKSDFAIGIFDLSNYAADIGRGIGISRDNNGCLAFRSVKATVSITCNAADMAEITRANLNICFYGIIIHITNNKLSRNTAYIIAVGIAIACLDRYVCRAIGQVTVILTCNTANIERTLHINNGDDIAIFYYTVIDTGHSTNVFRRIGSADYICFQLDIGYYRTCINKSKQTDGN